REHPSFMREYGKAVISGLEHYYCIARERSLTSPEAYLEFCRRHGLEHEEASLDILRPGKVALCIRAKEDLLDPGILRRICRRRLEASRVTLRLGSEAKYGALGSYDIVVNCTYSGLNSLLSGEPSMQRDFQFELCEKPVVQLPPAFAGKSVVIMDGPFMCVDPFGKTGLHLLGNVVHAIHKTNVGKFPDIDAAFLPLLDRGIVKAPPITNFGRFIESASEFMPLIRKAEHVGSMFTVRAVLPGMDATDARPTMVQSIDGRLISVFSGKLSSCVEAARQVSEIIGD
ncbi:MAG: hypothetical protein AB1529_06610, partial [Candidatus Micrarchaeota archaeon]